MGVRRGRDVYVEDEGGGYGGYGDYGAYVYWLRGDARGVKPPR